MPKAALTPYSAKFSRHLYFVDWPLKAISLHNVRGMTAYRILTNTFRGLNFRVEFQPTKSAKIKPLENFALYGNNSR